MKSGDDIRIQGSADPIVPIDFTPSTDTGRHLRLGLRPAHVVIAVFLFAAGAATWFLLTAKSVFIQADPITAEIEISGGLAMRLGPRYLIHPGFYDISLRNEGYHPLQGQLFVSEAQSQTHPFTLRKLPGRISIDVLELRDVRVQVDGVDVGVTPLVDMDMEAGEREIVLSKERYQPYREVLNIEGRQVPESFEFELAPAWATVSLSSDPPGADVLVDGELVGTTPLQADILEGEHELTVKLAGHKAWQDDIVVVARQAISLPSVSLEPADGLVFIRSEPSGASVTVSGDFKGLTPLEISLPPGERHAITLFKAGYESASRTITTAPDQELAVNLQLQPVVASVAIQAEPADAELLVNGEPRGPANQTIELMAVAQQIEIRRDGYVPYSTEFTSRPGLEQVIRVSLKSLEQARLEQIKPVITSAGGQTLKLFYPGRFTMGASRREAGRRPNETLRDVVLEKPFYISLHEVTNGEFKRFRPEHSSGTYQQQSLDLERQPVVRVTWHDAALYANWLSAREGLPLFYNEVDGEITGFNPDSNGYRLPTEAEWEWIARTDGSGNSLRYPWGEQLPPPENAGNFADLSTRAFLGEIVQNYNDNYIISAPVGQFTENFHGVFDMAGNVAEWVHDFYGAAGAVGGATEVDPLGPEAGQFHTIRGSSWAHGSITELRLSFRDFGEEPRDDVGFRVARYLGE
ncbi:MAG: hypothetical protein RLZZ385_2689 [Pseudomonadota bacterium]|jgi:formylglycine-generating enzyme required for sulfatase activity